MAIVILLVIMAPIVASYPFGAPPGICTFDEPMPNHMAKSPQTIPLPFEISMSKDQVTSVDDSITVSIKSKPGGPSFKGFVVLPKDDNGPIGTWDNDAISHPIEGCSATTHDNKTPKDNVQLIWRPGTKLPKGHIRMKAVIVQQFDTFWINIPVPVQGSAVSSHKSTQNPISSSSVTPTTTKISPIGGVPLPGLVSTTPGSKVAKSNADSEVITVKQVEISTQQGKLNLQTTTSGTSTEAATTKRRSLISRIFGGDKEKEKTTTSTTSTTTTTTTTTTTSKPTTTSPVTTTKKKSLISRIFGGGKEKTTSTTTTTTTTTTTAKPTTTTPVTTTKGPSFIRRLLGGKGKTTATTSSTVNNVTQSEELTTTTKPSSFVKRLFG